MFRWMPVWALFALLLPGCVIVADVKDDDDGLSARFAKPQRAEDLYETARSYKAFDATLADLMAAIDRRGMNIFATVDHAAGAASINSALPPTTLVIFGNPKGGTPLIDANRYMALALPLKALVWEADGKVMVAVTDIRTTARLHQVEIDKVDGVRRVLGDILREASE